MSSFSLMHWLIIACTFVPIPGLILAIRRRRRRIRSRGALILSGVYFALFALILTRAFSPPNLFFAAVTGAWLWYSWDANRRADRTPLGNRTITSQARIARQ
jgi:hypothetical protein